ncbi:GLI pathogenesis-related 2 [Festucalex cinctus]
MADASFQREFLEAHNAYRAQHNTPSMTLNSELNAAAQRWADRLLALGVPQHSGGDDGENIYYMWSSAPIKLTGKEAVDSWYGEVTKYSWSNPGFSGNTGHFTQVVWKASTQLGVGMATDGNKVFVVGQYRPAGNISMSHYFRENVLPRAGGGLTGGEASGGRPGDEGPSGAEEKPNLTTMADASFQREFLEAHNAYRAQHNAPSMTLNSELNAAAQRWADRLLALGVPQHSGGADGENIYYMWSSVPIKLTGKEAVDSWYGEVKQYSWSNPGFSGNTGHFTQVVWKASTQLGVGMATDGNKVFVVGQYRPAGNISMSHYFRENVLPRVGGGPSVEGPSGGGPSGGETNETGEKPNLTTSDTTMADASFQREFLEAHNAYRAQHNAPSMTLNNEMNAAAQRWADRLLALGVAQHSGGADGENIYYKWSSIPIKLTGKEAVDSWYGEVTKYSWSNPGFSGSTGHFTQVVWKASTQLGVGMATDGNKVFVVGQYRPAGNISMSHYFRENVLPRAGGGLTGGEASDGGPSDEGPSGAEEKPNLTTSETTMADASFQREFLEAHNAYRAQHNAPSMTLNSELNAAAQRWADRLLALGVAQHSGGDDGENIYYMWSSAPIKLTGKEAVDSWYGEVTKYSWSNPGYSGNTGHFTQVVWKASTQLGVGMATDGNNVFVVGQYRPAGNINTSHYFRENVLPRGGGPSGEVLDGGGHSGEGEYPKYSCRPF